MTKWQTIRTILGLFLIDALANYAIVLWSKHDPNLASPFVYFVIIPVINLFAVFLAFLQIYYYRHPEQEREQ